MSADGVVVAEKLMSISATQSAAFFSEIALQGCVWAIRDSAGFPTSTNASGETTMPFWSLESRANKIVDSVPAYSGFVPEKLKLDVFESRWLPGLERDGLLVGINWSGDSATGYDMKPADVAARLAIKP
jgi:hypothetical protein